MNAQTIAHIMISQNPEDSYNLAEEIALRGLFRTKRPEYLADTFAVIYHELAADIDARARLVDIGLRYEKNIPLNLAAARKIADLLDGHKILLIPAHIDLAPPEVAEAIAAQIRTIRSDDPRRYFFERWSSHENAAVRRICLAGRARFRETGWNESAAETARELARIKSHSRIAAHHTVEDSTGLAASPRPAASATVAESTRSAASNRLAAQHTVAASTRSAASIRLAAPAHRGATPAIRMETPPARISRSGPAAATAARQATSALQAASARSVASARPAAFTRPATPAPATAVSGSKQALFPEIDYAELLDRIEFHLEDSRPQVRLKWIKKTGTVPASFDPDDRHKVRIISRGIRDRAEAVTLEAVAQIAFLLHDKSKLELLLLVLAAQPALLGSAEGLQAIASLGPDLKRALDEALARKSEPVGHSSEGAGKAAESARVETAGKERRNGAAADGQGGSAEDGTSPDPAAKNTGKAKRELPDFGGNRQESASHAEPYGARTESAATGNDPGMGRIFAADEKKTAAEILSELDLPAAALAELENDRSAVGALVREIAPIAEADRTDNYFLRHTAVLHIKDLRTEELRYRLYLSVLGNDRKDIVRQIAVQEARNLGESHVASILGAALVDRAWQVRCAALDHLLPLMPDRTGRNDTLQKCTSDDDYHVRQKAEEKLAESGTSERLRK